MQKLKILTIPATERDKPMSYNNILCECVEGVANVTVNRPDKLNALNTETLGELEECFAALPLCAVDEEPEMGVPGFPCGTCRETLEEGERRFLIEFPPQIIAPKESLRISISNPCVDGLGRVQLGVRTRAGDRHRGVRNLEDFLTIFRILTPVKGELRSEKVGVRASLRASCRLGINPGDAFHARQHVFKWKKPLSDGSGDMDPLPGDPTSSSSSDPSGINEVGFCDDSGCAGD